MQFSSASDLREAIDELVAVPTLLIALDFDGTLAPEVDDPDDARSLPQAHAQLLRILEIPDTRLALISGRAIENLEYVSQLPRSVLFGGSHGLEFRFDEGAAEAPLDEDEAAALKTLNTITHEVADTAEGAWVELKPAGQAIHTRLCSAEDGERVQREALARVAQELPTVTVRKGKNNVEFAIHDATKADAIHRLRDYVGADAVFFAGDDVTDEDAIAVLGSHDLGVRVGEAPSVARLRVPGTADIAELLVLLADRREAVISARKTDGA
ncbi:MAG: trehalose-phosphatase [Rhodoglobus sp.]|uniref:trehalose-phosphatase n=1 Tax=uncultured Salinibacterium sp. TaxID=459274 RepID=UPI0030D7B024